MLTIFVNLPIFPWNSAYLSMKDRIRLQFFIWAAKSKRYLVFIVLETAEIACLVAIFYMSKKHTWQPNLV